MARKKRKYRRGRNLKKNGEKNRKHQNAEQTAIVFRNKKGKKFKNHKTSKS